MQQRDRFGDLPAGGEPEPEARLEQVLEGVRRSSALEFCRIPRGPLRARDLMQSFHHLCVRGARETGSLHQCHGQANIEPASRRSAERRRCGLNSQQVPHGRPARLGSDVNAGARKARDRSSAAPGRSVPLDSLVCHVGSTTGSRRHGEGESRRRFDPPMQSAASTLPVRMLSAPSPSPSPSSPPTYFRRCRNCCSPSESRRYPSRYRFRRLPLPFPGCRWNRWSILPCACAALRRAG